MNDYQTRDDRLRRASGLDPYYSRHDCDLNRAGNPFASMVLLFFGIVIGMFLIVTLKACEKPEAVTEYNNWCINCHNKRMALSQYFQKNGVDKPNVLAAAVLHPDVKRPRLMSAMAVKESPRQKPGDGGESRGYFQVKAKHWKHKLAEKKVSGDALTQVMDSERILDELVGDRKILRKALEAYGGSTTGAYSRMILAEVDRVPK